ncbi:penicillin-binding protein 2 [Brevibacillus sp. SYP-B805]|uniref:peptidoglycan D,D-transpeptidase FtsI family protein n=1 Tax=Brevibacillus sp. SYP-B805 TaxID=1578199 RepID=UPI0013EA9FBC|nr:penicillin-binding protein 2 [Brevibacillus sp. SYP-B805]NGQ94226.1 penicillin-binding protein 2 [Brevibacillus sp. SYP-B805]
MRAKRRSFLLLLLLTTLWAGLVLRLWWIQIAATHHFSAHDIDLVKSAVKQRQQSIMLNTGRGEILDRHGRSFTGVEQQALLLFPLAKGRDDLEEALARVAHIVHQPEAALLRTLQQAKTPVLLRDEEGKVVPLGEQQAKAVNELHLPGILALPVTERYPPDGVAKHVIGYVNRNPDIIRQAYEPEWKEGKMTLDSMVGASGLERSFDRFLQGVEPSILSYYVDGSGAPLQGLNVRYNRQDNAFYPLSLVTTLDRDIQQRMEEIADHNGIREGSIVVLDAKTGDVIAMVSRPSFDQTKVEVAGGAWQNHALKQLPPGSVFKTVVAAAALAEGTVSPTERFFCDGEYGKYGFSCWRKEGHGWLTMDEAFAQSCNVTFAQIAKRVGGEKIEEYARRLGLAAPVGHLSPQLFKLADFRQFDGEEAGSVFADGAPHSDEGVLIQTAIGQRDVRMTPLQAANMMVTILRGGTPGTVRIVSDITYRNGVTFHHFAPQLLETEGIDRVTAYKLQRLLANVVSDEDGTGSMLQHAAWTVAGKSGTAQTASAGAQLYHQWFVGYAPVKEPRYAIAVVVENQPANRSHLATAVFAQVVGALAAQSAKSDEPHAGSSPE